MEPHQEETNNITFRPARSKTQLAISTSNDTNMSIDTLDVTTGSLPDISCDISSERVNILLAKIEDLQIQLNSAHAEIEQLSLENRQLSKNNIDLTKKNVLYKKIGNSPAKFLPSTLSTPKNAKIQSKPKLQVHKQTQTKTIQEKIIEKTNSETQTSTKINKIFTQNTDKETQTNTYQPKEKIQHKNSISIRAKKLRSSTESKTDTKPKLCIISDNKTNKVLSIAQDTTINSFEACHYLTPSVSTKQLLKGLKNKIQDYTMNDYCIVLIGDQDFQQPNNQHKWIDLKKVTALSVKGLFECCAVELNQHNIVILCVYRVPKANNLDIFMTKFQQALHEISRKRFYNIIVAGDFNIDILKKTNVSLDFQCLLLNFNLKLALKQPTRLKSRTCIDNFAHNYKKPCATEVIELALSDHTAQLIKFPIKIFALLKYWRVKKRDYSIENVNKFSNILTGISFSEVYSAKDPNLAYNIFCDIFKLLYDLCFPFKILTIKTTKPVRWISRGIKLCCKKKRKLLWEHRKKPSEKSRDEYKKYTKILNKIIKLTQKAQNNHKIRTSKNKPKTTWRIINNAKRNIPSDTIQKICLNDSILLNKPIDIANAFNDFFVDKIIPIQTSGLNVTSRLTSQRDSMYLQPCIPTDVLKIILSLNNTNSVGYDDISTKILKSVAGIICKPISHIINLSISSGVFPDSLKISIIKPVHKKDSKECMGNYRPISLIPVISKIFEKHIYKSLYNYLESNQILCSEQKGFRENKTINMAIYDFLKLVTRNVDNKTPVCSIFCDMTQAFDYVRHDILLSKLEIYGVRGNTLQLIKSYLENRKQFTKITNINYKTKTEESHLSRERIVKYGVPQGSVLGPLLFIIYINDLPKATTHPISLFADDSTVTVACRNTDTYKNDIDLALTSIIDWLNNNNLKININKTKIIHFRQRDNAATKNIDIHYNSDNIEEVDSTKFLGLNIDKKLNWKSHIEALCKKINSSAYVLYKLAPVVDIETLLIAYHGIIASNIRYAIMFWGNSTDVLEVFKYQKRCIRTMFHLKVTDSCKPFFLKYKILTLPSLYILETAMFVKNHQNIFGRPSDLVVRNRRDNNKVCKISRKTTMMSKSIFAMAPSIYNKLPQSIRLLPSMEFQRKIKSILSNKCYYDINEFLIDKDFSAL